MFSVSLCAILHDARKERPGFDMENFGSFAGDEFY